jgi:endonuclease YncB( thermonuclease family)
LEKNGLAWHFIKYSDDKEYTELEIYARQNKLGLWADTKAIALWEWRNK